MYAETMPQTPPRPMPERKRSNSNSPHSRVLATSMVRLPKMISEARSALRRPKLSAYQPVVTPLRPIPSSVADASMPASLMLSSRSWRITGKAMVNKMISIASNR
ncbi:hypothetical protein D3C72_1319890 [compost metagenome]